MDDVRDERGRFLPGHRGGGRPRVAQAFKERCQQFMTEEGWQRLVEMAAGRGEDRRFALRMIIEYAYGKPTQPLAGDGAHDPLEIVIVRGD